MSVVLPQAMDLYAAELLALVEWLERADARDWLGDWSEWAHRGQREPEGDWRTWMLMAGRGFGKTRAGSEWVHGVVRAHGAVRVALVAATVEEARRVMVEGPSGLLATAAHPAETPWFEASLRRVTWPNGAEAVLFSGAHPDGLRGPEHHFAWCDELAKWRHPQESWDMMQLGLRGGEAPRALVTTTPRAGLAALKRVLASKGTVATGGASGENPHVAEAWLEAMAGGYAGPGRSPDRADAMVWALWALMLARRAEPGIRAILD